MSSGAKIARDRLESCALLPALTCSWCCSAQPGGQGRAASAARAHPWLLSWQAKLRSLALFLPRRPSLGLAIVIIRQTEPAAARHRHGKRNIVVNTGRENCTPASAGQKTDGSSAPQGSGPRIRLRIPDRYSYDYSVCAWLC